MKGWRGRVLHIDLGRGTHRVERPSPETLYKYVGGKGLAGCYLRERATLPWNSPDMPLCIFTGPLVATISPTSGRATVMSRSPLTGTVADSSVGGRLGTELKRAGWDGIVITGVSPFLCGIEIDHDRVTIANAATVAGLTTEQVTSRLRGKGAVAAIGPAAENRVRFSNIMVDRHHSAGRTGLGLSFAAKNLKYVAVKGTRRVPVDDLGALKRAREEIFRLAAASPVLMGEHGFSCFGTGAIYDLTDSRRMMPTDNFTKTSFEPASSLNAAAFKERYHPKKRGCKGCHILCKKISQEGRSMPEFETMSHFSALIGNVDINLVFEANSLCNRYGMDTISAAVTLACHAEITGERLTPGRVLSLLEEIGRGRGIGRELGQGSKRYAAHAGKPGLSMTVKGLELPAYDPRGAYGMALAYAVSTRGGCHLRAYPISHEILRKPVATDRFTFSGKARIIKIAEDQNAVVDSLTACKFIFFAATLEEYANVFTAVTGAETSAQDLMEVGERIYYNERIMNALNGFTKDDDDLPERFFREHGSSGDSIEIPHLDREEFVEARAKYYRIRGLDENGMPKEEVARGLGLTWNS